MRRTIAVAVLLALLLAASCGRRQAPSVVPAAVSAGIAVPRVTGTGDGDGFLRGADVSSLLSLLQSGVRFSDWDGRSLGTSIAAQGRGFMALLRDAGFNWVRFRVWNDPYDASGHGYGGGNNDLDAAVTMGTWASEAGLRVLIDFHYSDFWADPAKQQPPKAWANHDVERKAAEIERYTADSLHALLDAGVDIGMVQLGNETNGGICGETDWENRARLYAAGAAAVRAVSEEIRIALHFTDPQQSGAYGTIAEQLARYGVDYDVFASSYYPYWHGSAEALTDALRSVAETYGKQVLVAETAWPYTPEDGDGHPNAAGAETPQTPWPFSVQGQASEVAAVAQAVKDAGDAGIGVFYWEPAWIPVTRVYRADGSVDESLLALNRERWEAFGCGWAASAAAEYDPEDAGRWYGGSAADNQAMFDASGRPLESLRVFQYLQTGAEAP